MPKTFTTNVFASSYKDDFVDSDNYHRILFNSGRALQARELTQLQTIIQEEISRFGTGIYKEGAAVNPGQPEPSGVEFVKLNTGTNTLPDLVNGVSPLVGKNITGSSSAVVARVLKVIPAEGTDPATLFVAYNSTSAVINGGSSTIRFQSGENVTEPEGETLTIQSVNTLANPAVGEGCKFTCGSGDFFTRGRFVFTPSQEIILSKYVRLPSAIVGFKITEDIVTVADTNDLYDNQGATPNLSSPGADRYRIKLELINKADITDDENFVYFCQVVDGKVVDEATGSSDFNQPEKMLATRTAEESGDYLAKPFTITFSDDGNDLVANVSDGIAYIDGYRAKQTNPIPLTIPKPRTDATLTNEVAGISYGNYFITDAYKGQVGLSTFAPQNIYDANTGSGTVLGTCRVRAIRKDGNTAAGPFRLYVFDIKLNSGTSLRNAKSIGTSTNNFARLVLENSNAVLKDSTKNSLVFPLPNPRPKNIYDIDFEVQRVFTGTASGNQVSLNLSTNGETFVNPSDWLVTRGTGTFAVETSADFTGQATGAGVGTQDFVVKGLTNGAVTVVAKVNKAQPVQRSKTLSLPVTRTAAVQTDAVTGAVYLDLQKTDLYEVLAVKQTNSSGADISHLFTIDDGQRAGHYENARLVLEGGATSPGTVYCQFRHFIHGAGDFFSVNSYSGQVDYEDIPNYRVGPRTLVNLRDVIDFRSSVGSTGNFTGSGSAINELPSTGDVFQADVDYYLPRADKVIINRAGEVKVLQGEAGFNSQIPATPETTMGLFEIEHNAYGLNDSDSILNTLEAKVFRMSDIGKLETRINRLEEVTSLSLLELDTSALLVLDASGQPRMKSGFFVDNYKDRSFTDAENAENRSAIDPSRGLLAPQTIEDNIQLYFDSEASTNTILKGDTVFLNYTHKESISQPMVSGTENVNPFAVITGEGSIQLSPASDEWVQTKYKPANVINKTATEDLGTLNEGDLANGTATKRGFSQWIWSGRPWVPILGFGFLENPIFSGWRGQTGWNWNGVDTSTSRQSNGINMTGNTTRTEGNFRVTQRSYSQRVVVGERTVRKVVGNRTVSLTFIPFMRSRKIYFKSEGMRPSTRYFPFFDGTAVTDFCRGEDSFDRYGRRNSSVFYGNRYRKSLAHPEGSGELVSDANGVLIGSFFIPSNDTMRFRCGTREFKLLDISANNDEAALSNSRINYVAQGTLDTRQRTVHSTRITQERTRRWTETTRVRYRDPLAQSFTITNPSGAFVTKVDCFFASKDADVSIELQIRPMVNGVPSSDEIIGNAICVLAPSQVNVPSTQTQAGVEAAPTTFEFDEPIFLNPETDYAIVLLAESTEYNAYVAETYAFELGSTEKRISRQPSMGSLFKSQNGKTWSPDQTKDLTFKLHIAQFSTSPGTAVFENRDIELDALENNPIYTTSGSSLITLLFPNHGYNANDLTQDDKITISGLVSNTSYNGLQGSQINGVRTVVAVDGFGLTFNAAANATSSGRTGGDGVLADQQLQFDACIPNFSTLNPDDTTIQFKAKYTSGKSLAAVSGAQTKYGKDTVATTDVVIGEENFFTTPRLIANPYHEASSAHLNGEKSVTYTVEMDTVRADVSPLIDCQRTSLTTISNLIDNQSATTANGFNVPLGYVAETSAFGGSSLAKHMTIVGQLTETAVGLKVIMAALRPSGSNFDLYFRVANDGQSIFDTDWILQESEEVIAPDDQNFREYRFLIGGAGGSINPFTQYQFKIVMRSNNSSKIPVFKDFRAIAMAT